MEVRVRSRGVVIKSQSQTLEIRPLPFFDSSVFFFPCPVPGSADSESFSLFLSLYIRVQGLIGNGRAQLAPVTKETDSLVFKNDGIDHIAQYEFAHEKDKKRERERERDPRTVLHPQKWSNLRKSLRHEMFGSVPIWFECTVMGIKWGIRYPFMGECCPFVVAGGRKKRM